ncbi:MAG TPA: HAD family hydrolase [Planctomycetota bacterium]|jgi:HAD superfamily hydrolase (TIGR01509 family)
MLKAIFFDIDDTLVDRTKAMRSALDTFMQSRPDVFAISESERYVAACLERDKRGYAPRSQFSEWVVNSFPRLQMTPSEFWQACAQAILDNIVIDPAICNMLASLRGRYRLGVISNGHGSRQRRKLQRAGLSQYFDSIIISGELGVAKPDARIYAGALSRAGFCASESLLVGDDVERDVLGPMQHGMASCWVARGRSYPRELPQPCRIIESILDLPEAL